MPNSVQQLIEGHAKPLTVLPNDSVQKALDLMIEHDYSQSPSDKVLSVDEAMKG